MWSPRTANEPHPGPTGRRQTSTGGEADQSVATLSPCTIPSRRGPRNPGHSPSAATGAVPTGATATVAVREAAGVEATGDGAGDGTAMAGEGDGGDTGGGVAAASSRSSDVFVQRQRYVASCSPLMPSVLSSVQA